MQQYLKDLEACCAEIKTPFLKRFQKESGTLAGDLSEEMLQQEFFKFLVYNAIAHRETGHGITASPLIERMWRQAVLYSMWYFGISKVLKPLSGVDLLVRTDPAEFGDQVLER